MAKQIPLAVYIFRRLHQLGVRSVHGVPGDFNLTLLDHVVPSGLLWVGNCNELNAAYAADGYARVKQGVPGVVVTTFGVGELSAVNAIAGAFAEFAPVVHIVGTPVRAMQDKGVRVHHTLNDGRFDLFHKAYTDFTVAKARLRDEATAADMVDEALVACLRESRPVYIDVPMDFVDLKIDAARLDQPLIVPQPVNNLAEGAAQMVLERFHKAKKPVVLVDGETRSFGVAKEVDELVRESGIPIFTTSFGKSIVDESADTFHGVYSGDHGKLQYRKEFEACDLVLCFGPHHTDTNTYGYETIPRKEVTVNFNRRTLSFGDADETPELSLREVLQHLRGKLKLAPEASRALNAPFSSPRELIAALPPADPAAHLAQKDFWLRLSRLLLKPGDVVMTETGTAAYGGRDFVLPAHARSLSAVTWLSIGYMLPAAQGAALAQRELAAEGRKPGGVGARTVLIIGDGSLQMTVQEISTMIRHKLDVLIIVINNDGYTIERVIHGVEQEYNWVPRWRYRDALGFFGAELEGEHRSQTALAVNYGDLEKVLNDKEFVDGKGVRLLEVIMEKEDAPEFLLEILAAQRKRTADAAELAAQELAT